MRILLYESFKKVIGKTVNLDILGFESICKVDTGACTSSIHAKVDSVKDGILNITLLEHTGWKLNNKAISINDFKTTIVKSSNGEKETRYVVLLPVRFEGRYYNVEFTLNERQEMNYPVLLGRNFLSGFMIDVNK